VGPNEVTRRIKASRVEVYAALLDAQAVASWRAPRGMSCHVHEFDARVGGAFRVSLTYETSAGVGKTAGRTDTYHGHFARLVPNELVVEVLEFETDDARLAGEMTVTTALSDAKGATAVTVTFEGLPPGVSTLDNDTGTQMALANLAALVEARGDGGH
jgi:uncharacterized protein YndB with AHSA1/START domain